MNSFYNFLRGSVDMAFAGGSPERFLNSCAENDVVFWGLTRRGGELLFTVSLGDAERARYCAREVGGAARVLKKSGVPAFLRQFRRRFFLIFGLAAAIVLMLLANRRVWEIKVSGAQSVPESEILAALEAEGVSVGVLGADVSPQAIRNAVQLKIPELSWFTVNIIGSRAEVLVREAVPKPETVDEDAPADLVAARDGVVTQVRTFAGAAVVGRGDAVFAGEPLIRGEYLRAGEPVSVRALGEIRARTLRVYTACRPLAVLEKTPTGETRTKISLTAAKKRLDLYSNSAAAWDAHGKTTTRKSLSLFGTLTLPVTVVTQSLAEYELVESVLDHERTQNELAENLQARLIRDLEKTSGQSLAVSLTSEIIDGALYVTLKAECEENIATY